MHRLKTFVSKSVTLKNVITVVLCILLYPVVLYAFLICWITLGLYMQWEW